MGKRNGNSNSASDRVAAGNANSDGSIDAALSAVRAGIEPPADERRWVLVEIVGDQLTWTTHNLAVREARHIVLDAWEDMREHRT